MKGFRKRDEQKLGFTGNKLMLHLPHWEILSRSESLEENMTRWDVEILPSVSVTLRITKCWAGRDAQALVWTGLSDIACIWCCWQSWLGCPHSPQPRAQKTILMFKNCQWWKIGLWSMKNLFLPVKESCEKEWDSTYLNWGQLCPRDPSGDNICLLSIR